MQSNERPQRPPVARTEPRRHFGFKGAGWTQPSSPGETSAAAPGPIPSPDGHAPDAGQPPRPAADPRDSAYQAVNDAYRLIDDYLRQGQRVAENFWVPLASAAPELGAPDRFLRAMGDMTMAWVEVMQQWTEQQRPNSGAPRGTAGPFAVDNPASDNSAAASSASAPEANATSGLRVAVTCSTPVEVSIDLNPTALTTPLQATELRCATGEAPPLTDISLLADPDGAWVARLVVPEGQPAGTYNGLVLELPRLKPRGTISLTIHPPLDSNH